MTNERRYFKNSFGDSIELLPNIEKTLYPISNKPPEYYKNNLDEESYKNYYGQKIGITDIIDNDLLTFSLLMDYLEELGLLSEKKYDRALDIAGAEGVHAALFRGLYANHCDVADVRDGTDDELTKKLKRQIRKRYKHKFTDLLTARFSWFARFIDKKYPKGCLPRRKSSKHKNIPSFKNYYNFRFKRKPMVDNFIIGDWRETLKEKYDFVMNFQSFWLWDHRESFPKIASLLNKGGIFAVHAPYPWAGRPCGDKGGFLGGEFPFFEQRLTLDDIKRYYEENKPQLARFVDEMYNSYDPVRPTIRNYIDCALDNGLVLNGYKRLYHWQNYALISKKRSGTKILVDTNSRANNSDKILVDADEVLLNISRFRNDVHFEDLLTRAVLMVFHKP